MPDAARREEWTRLRDALLSPWRRRPAAMLRDLRELGWAVGVLLLATVGLGAFTREFFGSWALGVTLGLAVYVAVVFALILAANLLAVAAYDLVMAIRSRAGRRREEGRGQ